MRSIPAHAVETENLRREKQSFFMPLLSRARFDVDLSLCDSNSFLLRNFFGGGNELFLNDGYPDPGRHRHPARGTVKRNVKRAETSEVFGEMSASFFTPSRFMDFKCPSIGNVPRKSTLVSYFPPIPLKCETR